MPWKSLFGGAPARNGADVEGALHDEQWLEPRLLLQAHQAPLDALRLECGYDMERYQALMEAPMLQVAQWVHCLPATGSDHHCERGGLLRLSIETAVAAFRRSDGKFLGSLRDGTLHDRERERRLRYVVFLGALLRPLGHVVTHVHVTTPSVATPWNPLHEALWAWRRRVNAVALTMRWRPNSEVRASEAACVWIASRVLSAEMILPLIRAEDALLERLLAIVAGERSDELASLVEAAHQAVIERDGLRTAQRIEVKPVNRPLEQQLLEALRVLCREKWTMNTHRARVWCTDQGVFLDWRLAVHDLLIRLRASGLANVSEDPNRLAELMMAHQLILPNSEGLDGAHHLFKIQLSLRGTSKQILEVVKIADPERVGLSLQGVDPLPAEVWTLTDSASLARMPAQSAPPVQLNIATFETESVAPAALAPSAPTLSAPALQAPSVPTNDAALRRFGAPGVALQTLAVLLRASPPDLAVVETQEGLVIGYPEGVVRFCPRPEEFVSACGAQGLLVPERAGGRNYVRSAPANREDLPSRYIVLAPRVVKYLGLKRAAS